MKKTDKNKPSPVRTLADEPSPTPMVEENKLLLSFIVTTYNLTEGQITRCLKSIQRQELKRDSYEVIVVDDESEQSPEDIVMSCAKEMNVRFIRQPHARQGAARNSGMREAQGEFIQFVDGDDYLYGDTSKECIKCLQENDIDMVLYAWHTVSENENLVVNFRQEERTLEVWNSHGYMKANTLLGSCCVMCFRRSLLDLDSPSPLLFAENTYIEDEEFVTRLVWRSRRLGVLNHVGYAYIQHPHSTTNNNDPRHVDDLFAARFNALDGIIRLAVAEHQPNEGLERKIAWLSTDILRLALRDGNNWLSRTDDCIRQLQRRGLFPLPKANYGAKYDTFRRLSRHPQGRAQLHRIEMRRKK